MQIDAIDSTRLEPSSLIPVLLGSLPPLRVLELGTVVGSVSKTCSVVKRNGKRRRRGERRKRKDQLEFDKRDEKEKEEGKARVEDEKRNKDVPPQTGHPDPPCPALGSSRAARKGGVLF